MPTEPEHDVRRSGRLMSLLLVAATGGHLAQLYELAPRLPGYDETARWVTFNTPQSRSLLEGKHHTFLRYTGPRDALTAARNTLPARKILVSARPTLVVSTGNAIAVSFLPLAASMGIPAAYIESAARADGPSLTGRILRPIPGIRLYSQYSSWAKPPWQYVGSIFDRFDAVPAPSRPLRRILVSLGTINFDFRRLVERLMAIIPSDCEVIWQVGATDVSGLEIDAQVSLPAHQLQQEMRRADVVVAHAGIGSALAALDAGKRPILVPRERMHKEHIDDHQRQIATTLNLLGLATHRSVETLQTTDLVSASRYVVESKRMLPPLAISGRR
jgi:UDP-N-acetylglucosamine--N-acetylmuramyl-(pentapeptide) pyrophosphoryl-undecaprenol N-acetylglucosamine transferase